MTIKVDNLSIVKSEKTLLSKINFEIGAPELIGIIGENGAGKSTLMHCLSGLEASKQKISLNGRTLESYGNQELSKLRAVLPQNNDLIFSFQAREVVRLGLSLSSLSIEQQNEVVNDCLEEVDADTFAQNNYLYLSGGEKQRIQLARVLAQLYSSKEENKYLLLDEPTSALDLKHQVSVLKLLKKLSKKRIGVFIIIHDLNLASLFCDKILLLKQGTLVSFDTPKNIFKPELISKTFETDVLIMQHPQTSSPLMVNQIN
ncbi:heme ABC transporter ATP-binding protein [Kangiella sp. HZ709]|uniref:heme ABC transporter ATP-binding protein n=1 Tax=Kangiella sp. HZ709 TaxID=2666328 RepID=UPI0012B06733|nr:heme ABC transporter ATP-binding protein [Kangiella sp. HZ709]MRX27583.1 heme ABC transporter ATP-binding protein [Kangiella sp. HZ709]